LPAVPGEILYARPKEGDLNAATQLTRAVDRLSRRDLIAYLKRIAAPAQLSDQYGFALR